MKIEQIEIGKWYYAEYGFDVIIGRCEAKFEDSVLLWFRWGNLFRAKHHLGINRILGEGKDPRWIKGRT